MFYLEEKLFKPFVLLLSFIFLPVLIFLLGITIVDYELTLLVIFLVLTTAYISILFIVYRISKSRKNYLLLHDTCMEIRYPAINQNTGKLNICYQDVIHFEYYKITSIVSWLQLYNCVGPKCVYITYCQGKETFTELIGYMDFNDIKRISNDKNIPLIIH